MLVRCLPGCLPRILLVLATKCRQRRAITSLSRASGVPWSEDCGQGSARLVPPPGAVGPGVFPPLSEHTALARSLSDVVTRVRHLGLRE